MPIIPQLNGSHGTVAQVQACLIVTLLCVGCWQATKVTSAVVRYFWRQFLRPAKKLTDYGAWAVVTGATDGIGRQYCNMLAKQGENNISHVNACVRDLFPVTEARTMSAMKCRDEHLPDLEDRGEIASRGDRDSHSIRRGDQILRR
jgi:hypothetical protein